MERFYPVGQPGRKWCDNEKAEWLSGVTKKRSYKGEVVNRVLDLADRYLVDQYGMLTYPGENFPLYVLKTPEQDKTKPVILITGGVHGYETSGVHGALRFLEEKAQDYSDRFSFLVVPCVSPWGYEVINRWNPQATDPNRSFYTDSPAQESACLMKLVAGYDARILAHFDLHETTDSDETEFRRALAARDGTEFAPGEIPDGFYTVGDTENPQPEFQKSVIESVSRVTHIAEPDGDGKIIGSPLIQHGVINYPMKKLGLCGRVSGARFTTTTEVYPDSEKVTDDECNRAQVAAICGGLDYISRWLCSGG